MSFYQLLWIYGLITSIGYFICDQYLFLCQIIWSDKGICQGIGGNGGFTEFSELYPFSGLKPWITKLASVHWNNSPIY